MSAARDALALPVRGLALLILFVLAAPALWAVEALSALADVVRGPR